MTSILQSSLLNLAATFVSLVAGFLVSVITARLLGPAGSGTVAFAMWLVVCASAIADRGLPQIVLRYVAALGTDGASQKSLARTAFRSYLPGLALLFVLFLAYGIYRYANGKADPWLWAATALLFLAYALAAFSTAAARGRGRFREAAASTAIGSTLQVPMVLLGAFFLGPAGAIAAMMTRYLPQIFRLPGHLGKGERTVPAQLSPDMRRYGRSMWTTDVIDVVLLSRVEYLIVGYFLAKADIGYYAAAVVFAGLVSQLTLQLSPAFLVGLSATTRDGAVEERQHRLYRNSMRLTALFIMPIGIGGAAIVPRLLPMVFGVDFAPAAQSAALLLLASVPAGLAVVPWAYLAAREHGTSLMRLTLVSAAVIFLLLVAIVPSAGIFGAAVVRTATETFILVLLLWTVRAKGGPALPWSAVLRTAVAALACGAAAFAVTLWIPGLAGLLCATAAGALVYAMAIRVLGLINGEEADMLLAAAGSRLPPAAQVWARRGLGMLAGPHAK
jgi:O-antigen/teichoic acid export membrane protein